MDTKQLEKVIQCAYDCYSGIEKDENHRYLSWEHCHKVFKDLHSKRDEQTVDYLCLHLAWYLASWGMLRGGAFLLQKDYKIHKPVVNLICQPEWEDLWDITPENLAKREFAERIIALSKKIAAIYAEKTGRRASPTLLTKILLGTIGCTPAYDRYFTTGLGKIGLTKSFGVASLMQVGKMYLENREAFEKLREHCSKHIDYPPAKIIDMCFFESGMRE